MATALRFFALVLVGLFAANYGFAQVAPLLANIPGRATTNLDGQWQAIVDPYDVGYIDYRAQTAKNNNAFYKNHKPQSPSELVEYDFDTAGQLNVPGDWNTQRDSLLLYEGSVWYKRSFDYTKPGNKRLFVHFAAANYLANVYLNGEELGRHEGGFTPFDFEITDRAKPTGNFLVLRVNDMRAKEDVPTLNTDWWNYGGITRPVTLVEVPETFIRDYSVQLEKGSTHVVKGSIELDGPQLRQSVTIQIPEVGIKQTYRTDAGGRVEFSFPADLQLWSPANPKLYLVEISCDTDRINESIGFRSIAVEGTDILLNGKPIFLRGINLHEEAPTHASRSWSDEDARILLLWVKELGCNFVRLAHYPHNEAMIRMADQMGILVWEEIPVYWTIQWENPATLKNAQNQLGELISRDHNRAALIIYSVANETPINEARNHFLSELVRQAHSTDPTRLVSAALQADETDDGNRLTIQINDPLAAELDVMGENEYIGWYTHQMGDIDRTDWVSKYNKPLIMSEFGADAQFGRHGDPGARWTEEFQQTFYEHQIAMLKRISFLRGTTPWILKDFRSPRRTLPGIEDYFNRKGLVSDHGEKKKAFFVLRKYYQDMQNGKMQ